MVYQGQNACPPHLTITSDRVYSDGPSVLPSNEIASGRALAPCLLHHIHVGSRDDQVNLARPPPCLGTLEQLSTLQVVGVLEQIFLEFVADVFLDDDVVRIFLFACQSSSSFSQQMWDN